MDADDITCKNLPNLVSSFMDTFVEFSATGSFLPDPPSPPLIAIGDLHKSKLAGLIDSDDKPCGGSTTTPVHRRRQELKPLYFLEKPKRQAAKIGGNVITMNGNHEIMKVDGVFWCTRPSGFDEFTDNNRKKRLCDGLQKPRGLYDEIRSRFPGVKQEYGSGFRDGMLTSNPVYDQNRRDLQHEPRKIAKLRLS